MYLSLSFIFILCSLSLFIVLQLDLISAFQPAMSPIDLDPESDPWVMPMTVDSLIN